MLPIIVTELYLEILREKKFNTVFNNFVYYFPYRRHTIFNILYYILNLVIKLILTLAGKANRLLLMLTVVNKANCHFDKSQGEELSRAQSYFML